MKISKKIMLIAIFIMMLCCITAVSASDQNTTDEIAATDENVIDSGEINVLADEAKKEPTLNASIPDSMQAGGTYQIDVQSPSEIEENGINVYYDSHIIDRIIAKDGTGSFSFSPTKTGNHTLVFYYDENSKYSEKAFDFPVEINGYTLSLQKTTYLYNTTADILINAPDSMKGEITVTINDDAFNVSDEDYYYFKYDQLKLGNNTVNLYFKGDENISEINRTFIIKTYEKQEFNIKVDIPANITACEDTFFNVSVTADIQRDLNYYFDGDDWGNTIKIKNRTGQIQYFPKEIGEHTLTVKYYGDDLYLNSSVTKAFEINDYILDIDEKEVLLESPKFTLIHPNGFNGTVEITVNNKKYNITPENYSTFELDNLNPGENQLNLYYPGDESYKEFNRTMTVNVTTLIRLSTEMLYNATEYNTAYLVLPKDANGTLVLSVYDSKTKNYTERLSSKMENGSAVINLCDLGVGSHQVLIEYINDTKYSINATNETVEVAPIIRISDFAINGQDTYVEFCADNNTKGNLTVTFEAYDDFTHTYASPQIIAFSEIANGTTKINLPTLTSKGNIKAIYANGDYKYIGAAFFIPANMTTTIKNESEIQSHTKSFEVLFTNELYCDITYLFDNEVKDESWLFFDDSKTYYFETTDLTLGNHTIEIQLSDIDTFYSYKISFNVTDITITIPEKIVKNDAAANFATVETPIDAAGNITLIIDDVENATINLTGESVYAFNLTDIDFGTHTVEIIYSGDNVYNKTSKKQTVTVAYIPQILNDEICYGEENLVICVGDTTNPIIKIDGNVTEYTLDSPYATVDKSLLTVRNHEIAVEDENGSVLLNTTFYVYTSIINMNNIVKLTLPDDANGTLVVYERFFAEENYLLTKDMENGYAEINLNDLPYGSYQFYAKYINDNKYHPYQTSGYYEHDPALIQIKASANETTEGDVAVIDIEVTQETEGIILIDVGPIKAYVELENGKASANIIGLEAGEYNASVRYVKYENVNTSVIVKVNPKLNPEEKITPKMILDVPSEVESDETVSVSVRLPENATGVVSLKLDSKEFVNLTVEKGVAGIDLDNLDDGVHIIEATYLGDNLYNPASDVASVIVSELTPKKDTILTVDKTFTRVANDYNAGERGAFFYATLTDINGKPLANRIVQIAVNGPIYDVVTDEKGKAGLQVNLANANTYTYALAFQGDENYNAAPMASSKLTITKKKTSITASDSSFKASKKKKTITVTLKTTKNPYNGKTYLKAGKKLTLKVNGKSYTAKATGKGIAKFTIKLTKKGKFTAKIKFAGDKTYEASSKSIKVTIK